MLNKKQVVMILLFGIMVFLIPTTSAQRQDLKVTINGQSKVFNPAPFIENGRTLVPMRSFFESLGAKVNWEGDTRTAIGERNGIRIEIPIGQPYGKVNQSIYDLDVPARIIDDHTFIPLRFVGESLGEEVIWDDTTRTIRIGETANQFLSLHDITIGTKKKKVIEILGQPDRIDASKYNFEWYVYNQDYSQFVMVGIGDDEVKGVYSNSLPWQSIDEIKMGITKKQDVERLWGNPLQAILKGNTNYVIDSHGEYDVFKMHESYITVFYDVHEKDVVTAIQWIDEKSEQSLLAFYPEGNSRLKESFDRQVFDLANAIRVRKGLTPFRWDDDASLTAQKHSADMSQNDYFSHMNLKGQSPFERMTSDGIAYRLAAENIACGQTSAIFAHEAWMNSAGHRSNILGDCERLGVGVWFGGDYSLYYTQNFYTP